MHKAYVLTKNGYACIIFIVKAYNGREESMQRWTRKEYYAVYEAVAMTSPLSLEERHRVYLERARATQAFYFRLSNSDNEKRAIAAALDYQINLRKDLIKGYPERHNAVVKELKRIEVLEKAKKKILAAISDEKVKN